MQTTKTLLIKGGICLRGDGTLRPAGRSYPVPAKAVLVEMKISFLSGFILNGSVIQTAREKGSPPIVYTLIQSFFAL